jgi:predicted hydrocarbon binding protein
LDTAKNLWDAAVNMEDFLNKMNDMHIGGGNLRLQNGKIIGVYDTCYCSLPRLQPGMSSTYCFCSAGWFERLFSDVLKRPASVELIHSIVGGSEECVFEISF